MALGSRKNFRYRAAMRSEDVAQSTDPWRDVLQAIADGRYFEDGPCQLAKAALAAGDPLERLTELVERGDVLLTHTPPRGKVRTIYTYRMWYFTASARRRMVKARSVGELLRLAMAETIRRTR